jgi:TonB family protein
MGEETPAEPIEPASPSRGVDWVALLAWGGTVAVVFVLGGLLAIGFQSMGSPQEAMAGWWKSVTAERPRPAPAETPKHDDRLPVIPAPLPGDPLQGTPQDNADLEGRVIVNPSWVVPPRPEFPDLAYSKGVESGHVLLQCPVSADGAIESCWIVNETPKDVGFGQAALASAVKARLQPRTVDGVATGGMVRFTVNFRLG